MNHLGTAYDLGAATCFGAAGPAELCDLSTAWFQTSNFSCAELQASVHLNAWVYTP